MSGRRNRVLRKVRTVQTDDLNKEYNEKYGALVAKRDKDLAEINRTYEANVAVAADQRNRDRKEVQEKFEEDRKTMTRKLTPVS